MNPTSRSLFMVGQLIASLYIVLSILGIAYAVSFATYISVAIYYCLIIYFALNIICSLLVFVGIKKRESLFLMNWLVVQLIPLCYVILALILQPKLDTILIIPIVIGFAFHIYLWIIMIFVSRQCGQSESDDYISPEYFFYQKERAVNTGENNQNPRYAQSDFSYMEPSHSRDVDFQNNFHNIGDSSRMSVGQHKLPKYFHNQQKRKNKDKNMQSRRHTQSDSSYMEPSHVLSISDLMYQSGGAWSSVGNSGLGYVSHHGDVGLHSSSHHAYDSGFMSDGGGHSGGPGACDSGGGGGFDSGGGGCDSGGGGCDSGGGGCDSGGGGGGGCD